MKPKIFTLLSDTAIKRNGHKLPGSYNRRHSVLFVVKLILKKSEGTY